MKTSRRNYEYFQCEKRMALALLASGALLICLTILGLSYESSGKLFDLIWALHIVAHLTAFGSALGLLVLMSSALGRVPRVLFFLVVSAVAGMIGVLTWLPIISRDALLYHLAVPKWWIDAGRIVEIPWHEWSHFPLLLSTGYMGFLAHNFDRLTPLYHGTYLFLCSAIVAGFVQYKYQDEELSILGALITMTTPIALRLAGEPMADLAVATYFGGAFAWFIFWGDQRGARQELIAIGFMLGLALSMKYNAYLAVGMLLLAMVSFLQQWQRGLIESLGIMATLGAVALVTGGLWLAKNFYFTGNPFFPFAGETFGGVSTAPFQGNVSILDHHLHGYGERWWELLLIPFRMMIFGKDDIPRQFDGVLSPIYVLCFFSLARMRTAERWVGSTWMLVAGYFITSLLLFYPLLRYQSPLLVPAVVLLIGGLRVVEDYRAGKFRKWIRLAVIGIHLGFAGWYSAGLMEKRDALSILRGRESAGEYLSRHSDEYQLAQFVNTKLPEDARVYLVYTGNRFFYFDRAVRGAYFSHLPIIGWLSEKPDPNALRDGLKREGITHLAIHNDRAKRTFEQAFSENQKRAWTLFVQQDLEFVGQVGGVTVWRIREP